jgi:phosphatidylserine/phosphatidylglycerophosphate/cardiolipin synthase-like enzyme
MKMRRTRSVWTLRAPALLLCFLCTLLTGCATSLPNVQALTEATANAKPEITGPRGKLSPRQSRVLLARQEERADAANLVKKTVALMESLSGHPMTSGNKITLLVDGPATYDAMFKAIGAAKDNVNFETFTFSDDEVGRKFADLLDEDLLESGVQVYERRARMIHAKTVIIDCVWSTVGSTNMDLWSFVRDNEINVVVIGTDFADQLEELFEEDIAHSNQITKEQWSKRPLIDRAKEFFCVLFSHWL